MEFNQDNRSFSMPAAVLDTVAEQLADVDLTLPDYCPDIEKILKCTLTPKIQSKSLSGGQLQIDGYCVVNVLYVESIKKTIRCCEQSVNFSQSFSVKDAPSDPIIITKTKSEYINCRALSPRRLVMHGAFSLYAKVLTSVKTNIFSSNDRLETCKKSIRCASLKSFCQEQFNVCEEISVSDKPEIEAMLHSDVGVGITDVKAVTGKLMLNGEINLKIFYLCDVDSGQTGKIDYILPFNQIIDCEGIDENTVNLVTCDIMSYDIRLKNDMLSEKPAVVLDVKLCVTEEGYCITDEEIVADAYSIYCASKPEFELLNTVSEVSSLNELHMEKLTVTVDDCKLSKILDIYSDCVTAEMKSVDGIPKLCGKINVCVFALNEENIPVLIERSTDYEHALSSSSDCNSLVNLSARLSSISYRLADDNSVEIRCEIKLNAGALKRDTVRAVKNVELFEDKKVVPESCALTLYFAKKGESLWDIAKSHNTRLSGILNENGIDGNMSESPRMLLIPRI